MGKKWYYYRVYGLNLQSDIKIDEFMEIDEKSQIDVRITYDEIPNDIKEKMKNGRSYEGSKERMWFHVKDIGTYDVVNGKEIHYTPSENADIYHMKIFITCSCMGFIMFQRNKIAIHGGTIVIGNKAVIVTGDKGAGKSTLTSALRKKGYKFLADDISAIEFENDEVVVNPGFPYQKLCSDAVENMGYDKSKYFSFMSDKEIKYLIPSFNEFVDHNCKIGAIFKLSKDESADYVYMEEIKSSNKIIEIIKNVYRGEFMGIIGGMPVDYFNNCMKIAKSVKVYNLVRPAEGFTVDNQVRLIENEILSNEILEIN